MNTQHSSKFRHSKFVAALAALALVTAACGGSDDSAEAPLPTDSPTTTVVALADTETAPETTTTTTEPIAEPEEPTAPEPEPVVEIAPDDEVQEGHEEVEGFPESEPVAVVEQDVICGEGLVLMEEFVTDTDNGCRPETCDHGRDDHGDCALPPEDEPLTEEKAAALPTETIPYEEYGLEGCTEVSLGVCDLEGVLYCHDTLSGWAECPGQPSGDPCEYDENDPLSLSGSVQVTGQAPEVTLAAGLYRVDVCLSSNDVATGNASAFLVYFPAVVNEDNIIIGGALLTPGDTSVVGGPVVDEQSVVSGNWSRDIQIVWLGEAEPFEIYVTPEGNGTWVLRFVLLN